MGGAATPIMQQAILAPELPFARLPASPPFPKSSVPL